MTNRLLIIDDCKVLVRFCARITSNHPEFKYSLNDQLMRSSLSVGSNIAEANQRYGKDRVRLLHVALGSLEECRFQIDCYNTLDEIEQTINKIRGTIMKLIQSQSQSQSQSS